MSSAQIKVLIVDDVSETRENVRKLLQFESDVEVVGAARTGREAIEMAAELRPDVILMDINMPDMDGISATEAILQRSPFIQIIILSVQSDPNYMRRAMLAGARDFLTKPPMGDDLIAAIRRSGKLAQQEKAKSVQPYPAAGQAAAASVAMSGMPLSSGRVIVVYSPKGGTGTTTLAVNLALALHNDDTRTAIVDGNLQFGDVAVFLNEQGKNTILDLALRAEELDPEIVESVMIRHSASGVHVLASPTKPEQAEGITGDQFNKLIEYMRQLYAYIVIDTPSLLTDITLAAIDASDVIVLVATQDIPSIKNARLFLDLIHTLGIERNRIVFAMNRYDKRITITPERVGENLRQAVEAIIPLDERIVIPSVNRGVPFVLDNKTQPAARGIFALAESIRNHLDASEVEEAIPVRK